MKRFLLAGAVLLSALTLSAQATLDDIRQSPGRAGGVYYAYPVTSSANTPAPKGYQPFYISHYGRHGSRYLISDDDYKRTIDLLHRADEAHALTPLGVDLMNRLDTVWEEAYGRGGELTPLGARQHHDIAQRMYRAFPQAFPDNADITAKSTVVMRCAHSMFAFVEGLKELNPRLQIPRESGNRAMCYLNHHTKESGRMSGHDGPWYQDFLCFKEEQTKPDRIMDALFADKAWARRWVNPRDLMWNLYWIQVDLQNMETSVRMDDILTPEELYDLWQVNNFNFYACNSSYPLAEGMLTDNAKPLLTNILETAQEYINEHKHGATLRFGHDGNIIPLVALMRLKGCNAYEADPARLADVYADWRISPMASNMQMVFFRNGKTDDVIVKFMLNERETSIPIDTDIYPFYHWADVEKYLRTTIDTPSAEYIR